MNQLSAEFSIKKLVLSLSLLMTGLMLTGCGQEQVVAEAAAPVVKPALTELVSRSQGDALSFNGVVQAAMRAELSFRINGRVIELLAEEGDRVQTGQVLARLDARDAQTALASASLELQNVQAEYERAKAIYQQSKAISKSQLDQLNTNFQLAKNRHDEAQRQLDYTEIKAPFDGVVGRLHIDNFIQVQANTSVLTLHDLDDLEVQIQVPDTVMLSATNAGKAVAEISGIHNHLFPLSLRSYATQADPVSQTYAVVLGIDNEKQYHILPGMSVKVLPLQQQADQSTALGAMTLPVVAVVPDNQGKQFVWIVNDENQVEARYVEVGALIGNRVEITSNLQVGEQVVVAGTSSLQQGMTIRPMLNNEAQ